MKKLFFIFLLLKFNATFSQAEIRDGYGRAVLLHGLNTSSSAKHSDNHHPWINETDVAREANEFGFNAVRYLVFWGAIEPEKGKYNEQYLQEVKTRLDWYAKNKIYVIIDMHQDIFGYGVGGNGAPAWASTYAKPNNLIPDKWAWWLQNLEPKVKKSYVTFFQPVVENELQQHYINAWLKLIETIKDNPFVIGYDLMNEPHGGNLINTLFGKFEKKQLSFFYTQLISKIRTVDSYRYLFIEPRSFGVNFGMKSFLPKINDTISPAKLVYAPHCYLTFVDVGGDYTKKHQKGLQKWYKNRLKEAEKQQMPMLIGEFGLSPSKKGYDKYLQDIFANATKNFVSWTYWSNDQGGWSPLSGDRKPTPILTELVQPYPKSIAGDVLAFEYNQVTDFFSLTYVAKDCHEMPTEIFIPNAIYQNHLSIEIKGTENYTTQQDESNQTLKIFTKNPGDSVTVLIRKVF